MTSPGSVANIICRQKWLPACIRLCLFLSLCGARAAGLSADSFSLSFDEAGRPAACHRKADGADLLKKGNPGQGFYFAFPDSGPVRLDRVSLLPDGRLSARSDDGKMEVTFRVTHGQRYLALRIDEVTGVRRNGAEELHFEMNSGPDVRVLPLDYMTEADNSARGIRVSWPSLTHISPQDPAGGFAIYEKTGDDDEDTTLLRIWAGEKLPHPSVPGPWTEERARRWVADWQRRFADRTQLILAGRNMTDLRKGVEFAGRAGIRQIFLFTDTWRTDPFWPDTDLNWAVNRKVFPRGETDLQAFSDFVRSRGMYLALHYVSGGIGLRDPLYVGEKPDRRFASWGGGQLEHGAGAADATLVFHPAPGVVPPSRHRPAYPEFFESDVLRVGDELIRAGSINPEQDGTWTLKQCRRGLGSTKAAAHPRGTDVAGLLVAYGQNLVPDNDSGLMEEVAGHYAGLLNKCLVEHVEFDGAEIHSQDGWWGYDKFATLVYEALDHPTTAHDSRGRTPPAWFEYRLNSSRKLMQGNCSYSHGGYCVPVTLATPSRPATTLLDAHFSLSQGNYGGALGIEKPEPMFGVTPQVLGTHGLTGQFVEALETWKAVCPLLTDEQRNRINATFTSPESGPDSFNPHLASSTVWVAGKAGDHYEITPTHVLTRPSGDIRWQYGQEYGPVSPRQFTKPGESLILDNPDAPQPLQFIIHVLPAFDPQGAAATAVTGTAPARMTATDLFTTGNNPTGGADAGVPAGNVSLMPSGTAAIKAAGSTSAAMDGPSLILTASNPYGHPQRETENLPSWNVSVDMTHQRGLGMWVTGDNSGALLLVEAGRRDYVVPVDFNGRRHIEIPNGEVSWVNGDWGWRMGTKSADYSKVRSIRIGFGRIPPGGSATVKVEQLTALGEIPVPLENPVVHTGSGQLSVQGSTGSGQFLQYTGGDSAVLYDENWHRLGELPVRKDNYVMPSGLSKVTVNSGQSGPAPWLDVQFVTTGTPMILTAK